MSESQSEIPLYLFTYNVNKRAQSPESLGSKLIASLPKQPPKLLVFGFEELCSVYESFFPVSSLQHLGSLETIVLEALSKQYSEKSLQIETIAKFTHGALGLFVVGINGENGKEFATRNHLFGRSSCGFLYSSLKGGCAIRLQFKYSTAEEWTEFTFADFHLTPKQGKGYLFQRDEDFKYLTRSIEFHGEGAYAEGGTDTNPASSSITAPYDPNPTELADYQGLFKPDSHVIIMGDLNYRTVVNPFTIYEETPSQVKLQLVDAGEQPGVSSSADDPDKAFYHPSIDELALSLANKNGWLRKLKLKEPKIAFRPTYKFKIGKLDAGNQIYNVDSSHNPSWCDRILFLNTYGGRGVVKVNRYHKIGGLVESDHQPVFLDVVVPFTAPQPIISQDGFLTLLQKVELDPEFAATDVTPLVEKFQMKIEGRYQYVKYGTVLSDAILAYLFFFLEYKVGWLALVLFALLLVCKAIGL
ncbi:hypothetical protein BABINDRAFT_10342 [Babjeviella inositovora NRRL Y-12698]|uniref:Inositol polyphosphate-related phosphatase domain-containing protein n=1 Tax=Babjeviella inositovora NRRL Y-12698 TaxID=984486 RepID=A0A1E3QHM3_9ASCO|nr:uncharacterized protein BABINDRAFT_10342 [Babjeviella inositovora NRRL Y-12698]ODQ77191.1 hypothetical protein BABINDRAFT_10342 [Babjeviella inositovora NRRL Y-12698]